MTKKEKTETKMRDDYHIIFFFTAKSVQTSDKRFSKCTQLKNAHRKQRS